MNKLRVGVVGATGMVGQRFITLLQNLFYQFSSAFSNCHCSKSSISCMAV